MNKNEMLLVMTICNLMGKEARPHDVQTAYRESKEKLEQSEMPPLKGEIFRRSD